MSSTPATTARTTRGATIGRVLIVVGGVLAALSSWLNWGAENRELRAPTRTAYTIPAKFVIDNNVEVPGGGISLGIVVLVLGILVVVAAFVPGWKVAGLLLGLAVGVVAVLYAYQVRKIIHDAPPTSPIAGKSFRDLISIGPYIAGIGGALAVIGAVIALIPSGFWSSLTSDEDEQKPAEKPEAKPAGEGGTPS
jgi:hypothetical protein